MIYADFHIHTTFSFDSTLSPKMLVERLHAHPLVKVAAVTDHGTVEGIKPVQRLAAAYSDLLIIPGVEITTWQGDIVVLGTDVLPPKPWTAKNVVRFAKKIDAITIAVHPYRESGMGDYTQSSGVDAIEVLNGGSSVEANRQARELAQSLGLPAVGGSDSHRPEDLFTIYNQVQAEPNIPQILAAVRSGLVVPCSAYKSIHF